MKKVMKRLSMLLLILSVFWLVGTDEKQVLAAGNEAYFTEPIEGVEITNEMVAPSPTTQGKDNYIFAGYYTEPECETPVTATTDQTVYAKFVPSKVLSVKAQMKYGTTGESQSTNLRLVSSVDSLNYKSVGYEIYYNNATKPIVVKTSTVYERIVASATSGVDYKYNPKVVDAESEYFITATLLNINKANFDKGFYIKPYWKTLDGTTVYGEGKYFTVNAGLNTNNVNVPVKVGAALNADTLSVTVGGTKYPATVVYYDGTYAYLNITVANRDTTLKSLSEVVVTDGTTNGTALYRNLLTTYTGTADTSWYDVVEDTNKYTIATSADLYGIAKIANEGAADGTKDNFADKEIYVVADIAVNTETLIDDSTDANNYTKWRSYNWTTGEYTYAAAPEYSWTPISEFAGKFYGGGHTISGLYASSTSTDRLGFIHTTLATAELSNFNLVNSRFVRTETAVACAPIGSIIGGGSGKLQSIYSAALLDNKSGYTGGMVGLVSSNFTMDNCWFDGSVTGRKTGETRVGGLIGYIEGSGNTISNCLNSGDVNGIASSSDKIAAVGGIIGLINKNSSVKVQNVLNTGKIQISAGTTSSVHPLIGYLMSRASLTNVYSTPSDGITLEDSNKVEEADIMGNDAQTALPAEFFDDGVWTTVNAHTPVLTSLKTAVIDDTWYDEDEDTFVLYDKADLYGLATLSQDIDFAGKTIRLGSNIEVNTGLATTWETTAPKREWITIGNSTVPFAGTFDGGLHTIQGLYLDTDNRGGLFAGTTSSAVVADLYLENSYFKNTTTGAMSNIGTIAGVAEGTFNTVYSNAIVTGNGQGIGGLIGQSTGDLTMMNCWFAGSAISTREKDARLGGLIGTVTGGTASTNFIYNCLNTGNVNASAATATEIRVGGLVGHVKSSQSIQLKNSLNVGLVQYNEATSLFDGLIGATSTGTTVTNCYATTDSCSDVGTTVTNAAVEKSAITGDAATTKLSSFDFTNIWQTVQDSTPTLNFVQANQSFDTSWYNVAATEYVLYDKDDLYGFADLSKTINFLGKTIKLGNDIVVNTGNAADWATYAPKYSWPMIGSSSTYFKGIFDGDMHTISGLYRSVGEVQFNGLFARTDSATIKNLRLVNSYFKNDQQYFGSISGYDNAGTFDSIYTDAIVYSSSRTGGGLIGRIGNTSINNCWFDGSVTSTRSGADNRIGGLAGVIYTGTNQITNCLNSGIVTAGNTTNAAVYTGGLMGIIESAATVELKSCLNVGMIKYKSGSSSYGSIVGSVKGTLTLTEEEKSYAANDTCSAKGYSNGNLVVIARTNMGGAKAETNMEGFDFENTWAIVPESTPVPKSFVDVAIDTSWYAKEENEYVLKDKADLFGFAVLSRDAAYEGFEGKVVKLGSDILVNKGASSAWASAVPNYIWVTIGTSDYPFEGTFDGCGHTISGLYISTGNAGGLFGVTADSAEVKNFKLVNSYFNSTTTSQSYLGSVAGVGKGSFHAIYSSATVVGKGARIGGLVGNAQGNEFAMTNCWFDGSVTSSRTDDVRTGGLVGSASDGTGFVIENCLNTGLVDASDVTSAEVRIGGLVGHVQSNKTLDLKCSLNTGEVTYNTGTGLYGSLVGAPSTVTTVTSSFATNESCAVLGTTDGTQVAESEIIGEDAKTKLIGFNFYTAWSTREDEIPVPVMETVTLDEFIVSDATDLIAIATMSKTTNFAGKTIKLANNIDLTDIAWTPIGTSDSATRFAGTFDGQGYTISNLHMEATSDYAGLFAATTTDAVVKNLIIDDANITSTAKFAGIVAGLGHGTFSDIRVENAALTGGGRLGGLIGLAQNSVTLSNCSFSGTVTCVGSDKENRYIGGLLGYVTGGTLKISNCMNAGTIIGSPDCTSDNPGVGGLVGCLNGAKSVAINSCVNVGTITVEATAAVLGVGPVIGRYTAPSGGFEMFAIEKCYTVPSKDLVGIDGIAEVTVDAVKADAEATMPLLDWTTQWESVDGDFPKVRFSKTGFVASESLEVDSTSLTNLTTVYSATQVLKQGDIHAHAGNGGGSDGTVSLADWKTQMLPENLDMDFAASLDHRETDHILLADWDKDKFIYGTELGTNIHDTYVDGVELGLHYNMIYSNMEDFVALLTETEFEDDFDYLETASTGQYYNGGHIKEAGFDTAAEYKRFIQAVQQYNGFYILAHPMASPSYITADNWEQALKPYLVDGIGVEVMYKGLGTTNVKQGYQLWKTLLNNGYQVYATAGTDTHANLQTSLPDSGLLEALTSFYATIGTDETYWSEAYVRYLKAGNFTAGSVGIQMSVGSTPMGSTGSFEDAYLEIGIGVLHKSVYNEEHKYRVDVWSEDGIMYSQPFNATTEDGQMTYLRTKADANCKYYRVEIYDVTTNTRIALGNPIWNSAK